MRWVPLASALAISVTGCASSGTGVHPAVPIERSDAQYTIRPPDQLRITVAPEPTISRDVLVRPDGWVSFDLIGEVFVLGRTVDEVREQVRLRMSEFIAEPDVTVELTATNSRRFYVFGEVRRPGSYLFDRGVTCLEAFAQAGGATSAGDRRRATVVRSIEGGQLTYRVDFEAIVEDGDMTTNCKLQEGDVIYVPPTPGRRLEYWWESVRYRYAPRYSRIRTGDDGCFSVKPAEEQFLR